MKQWAAALQEKYPQPTGIAQEARNRICLDGHLNKALDDIMGCNGIGGPDAMFNLLGSLAGKAIDIALELASPLLPQQGGEQTGWQEMMSAYALCPSGLSHPEQMKWITAKFRELTAAVLPQVGEKTAVPRTMKHQALLAGYVEGTDHYFHFENGFTKASEIYAAPASLGEAKAVHFYRQASCGWIEKVDSNADPRDYMDHRIFEFRTLYAAPPSTDAKDAERWREALLHVGGGRADGGQQFTLRYLTPIKGCDVMWGSAAGHFTSAIDVAIAAKEPK
jgi:hypothetical protein